MSPADPENTGPSLSQPPANENIEATGPSGAIANFNVTASDPVDGSDPVAYTMGSAAVVSGETVLSLGQHLITASATDSQGITASESFSVNVVDTTPPVITVPRNITVEATSPLGAVVDFTTSAVDLVDGQEPTRSIPASGSEFAIGTTIVTVASSDASGNTASAHFDVTVVDTTPPVITVPANITVEATSALGAVVDYSTSAVDLVDGEEPTRSVPASGSEFAIGTTIVTVTSSDASGNTAAAHFSVTVDAAAACYCRGTQIRTARGEIPIENLVVGDLALTAFGERRPIRWLGVRHIDCRRYRDPSAVWPICIRAGAISAGQPARDLWVSPGHSLFIDGVLIQAEKLVNGASVVQARCDHVEYWHLELDSHDVVVANGMPAESYLDTGNRTAFANGGAFVEIHPHFRPKQWTETCVPLITEGPEVVDAKAAVLARALTLGHVLTDDSNAHVVAGGQRFEPVHGAAKNLIFRLPAGRTAIELRCRTFIPAQISPQSDDRRALGICVRRWQIDGADIALDHDSKFAQGWHALERHATGHQHRWSRQCVPLPDGTRLLVIDLAGRSYCWAEQERASSASSA